MTQMQISTSLFRMQIYWREKFINKARMSEHGRAIEL